MGRNMGRVERPLTALEVASIAEPGRYRASANLLLQVTPAGTKAWLFRYRRDGLTRDMGLGSAQVIKLAKARELALRYRQCLAEGKDPIAERNAARRTAATAETTFREFAEEFIKLKESGWRNEKTAEQFRSSLERYAYSVIGDLPPDAVTTDHMVEILAPLWSRVPVMADHVRSNVAVVLDAAKARKLRTGDNPARWAGTLQHLLPRAERVRMPRHHAALPYANIPALVRELRKRGTIATMALEFTILTAARTAEVIGATWGEIDFKAKLWIVPGERMKGGKPHRVPLSPRAIALLKSVPREADNPHVFPGQRRGRGLSNMAMLKLLQSVQPEATVHGMRSAFRDWASEVAKAAHEVKEAALAHVVGGRTVRAYARSDLLEERRELMKRWADYLR